MPAVNVAYNGAMSEDPNNRPRQLEALIDALEHLIPLAVANRREPWLPHLDYCLRFAKHLSQVGFRQADLDELSKQVEDIFAGGMGGFLDVTPTVDPEAFEKWSSATFEHGQSLHLVETPKTSD